MKAKRTQLPEERFIASCGTSLLSLADPPAVHARGVEGVFVQLQKLILNHAQGQLRMICEAHFAASGKGLRPKLVFEMAHSLSIPERFWPLVRNWAVALEILHNATLIHDDLQDGDHVRRNQPTVWSRFGTNAAINAGDFLLTLGPRAIDEDIEDLFSERLILHRIYSETAAKLVNGQSLEFEMSASLTNPSHLESLYWKCIDLKTSALFSGAARGVAGIAGLDKDETQRLENLIQTLGALFQLQDDIVDIFGDKQRTQPACDLREGKVSCLVLNHLYLNPGETSELIAHLGTERDSITDQMVQHWVSRFRSGGALQLAISQVNERREIIAESVQKLSNSALRDFVLKLETEFLTPIENLLYTRPLDV